MTAKKRISSLKKVMINLQKILGKTVNYATSDNFLYEDKTYKCLLSEVKVKSSIPIVIGAHHSVSTILRMAAWSGFSVRDIYPIARSVLETLINASYIMVEEDGVAEKALRYAAYADYKYSNREIGSGKLRLKISSTSGDEEPKLKQFLSEFKGKKSWADLDLPNRIRVIGERGFESAEQDFLGAYALIYSVSSDIIHGSPYGFRFFMNHIDKKNLSNSNFLKGVEEHLEWVLISTTLALCAYISVFSKINNMEAAAQLAKDLSLEVLKDKVSRKPK